MTRRNSLVTFDHNSTVHAGLWLDKFIRNAKKGEMRSEKESERAALVREISFSKVNAHSNVSSQYERFYTDWQTSLTHLGARFAEANTSGKNRIAVGLGADSVLETSITLHRTWGVPYIPGSALKGLAASYARQRLGDGWRKDEPNYLEVFGDTTQNGAVTFFDALPILNTIELLEDTITPHHSAYYNGKEPVPPADWDSPTPIPFISARGTFLTALAASSHHIQNPVLVVELAHKILKKAFMEFGIGAKTSSGYGRLSLKDLSQLEAQIVTSDDSISDPPQIPPENPDNQNARELLASVKIPPLRNKFQDNPGEYIPNFLTMKPDPDVKFKIAKEFWALLSDEQREKQAKKALEKRQEKKVHWFETLRELIGEPL